MFLGLWVRKRFEAGMPKTEVFFVQAKNPK
jgi:hypothetical protein